MAGTGQSTLSLSGLTMLLSITQQLRCQPRPGHQNASPSPLCWPHKTQCSGQQYPPHNGGVKVMADTWDWLCCCISASHHNGCPGAGADCRNEKEFLDQMNMRVFMLLLDMFMICLIAVNEAFRVL